jgi:tetratricopeptide (TPR) repeat protein
MKAFLLPLALLCVSFTALGQIKLLSKDAPVEEKINTLTFQNTTMDKLKTGDQVEKGQPIGRVASLPAKRSEKFDQQLKQSELYYQSGAYAQAAEVLTQALAQEPQNLFLLNAYARALYKIDNRRDDSYQAYKTLVSRLDAMAASPTELSLSHWFIESYWKLGTLHMDHEQWREAILEIGKFMIMAESQQKEPVYEQALSYLTECAFGMKDKTLTQHFGKRTLEVNPGNDYVLEYLEAVAKM